MAAPFRILRSADRPQADELKVFISYSRRDALDFVDRLQPALAKHGIEAYVDREDIEKGEEWWERIEQLITEADTVIFVMTPGSANSEICHREVDFADRVKKRFLPVIAADITGQSVPLAVARLNYIFFIENRNAGASGNFEQAVTELAEAVNTNIGWIREHTRIGALAHRWDKRERPDEMLLRGAELAAAETWLTGRPKKAPDPTSVHIAFVTQSRHAATRRQRMTLGISVAAALIAIGLAAYAWMQRNEAVQRVADLCQSWRVTTDWVEQNVTAGIYDIRGRLYDVFQYDEKCR